MNMVKNACGTTTILTALLLVGGMDHKITHAANPNAEKTRAHFQQNDTYFKLEKYPNTLQEFEQTYLAKQDTSFLYNIAQYHHLIKNQIKTIRFYKHYLADAPNTANHPMTEKHIRELETTLNTEELTDAHVAPPPTPRTRAPNGTPPIAMAPPTTAPTTVALDVRPSPSPSTMLTNPPAISQSEDHPIYTK